MIDSMKVATTNLTNDQLLQGLEKLVKSERKLMHIILQYIHEVEVRKLHLDMGFDSIFKFLTIHHGYSEDAAYARMHGARLLAKVPELQEKLEQGSISLTQISKVCSAIRAEKKLGKNVSNEQTLYLLSKIENKSILETRQTIAVELNQPIVEAQSVKPQKDESYLIQVTMSKSQYDIFQKAQSFVSHSVTDGNIADTIQYLSEFLIKKVEGSSERGDVSSHTKAEKLSYGVPKLNSQNSESAQARKHEQISGFATRSFRVIRKGRKYLSIKVRRQLMAEANHRCSFEHPESGFVCKSRYQLQVDHIIPVSEGGWDDISNLRIMCGIHNRDRNRNRKQNDLQGSSQGSFIGTY